MEDDGFDDGWEEREEGDGRSSREGPGAWHERKERLTEDWRGVGQQMGSAFVNDLKLSQRLKQASWEEHLGRVDEAVDDG